MVVTKISFKSLPSVLCLMKSFLQYQPFHNKDQNELFKIIRLGKYSFDSKYWSKVSEEGMKLIMRLLEVDPSARYTATDALGSDWIKSMEESRLSTRDLATSLTGISKESNRLKGLVKSVQWINKAAKKDKFNMSSLTVDVLPFDPMTLLQD